MQNKDMYADKVAHYFTAVREDIIALVPQGTNRVMEIGCGTGNTLVRLKGCGKAREVVGIDIVDRDSRHDALDRYIAGDIEKLELDYPRDYFDVVIFPDVLEHLVNPWNVVGKLFLHLRPDGLMIASIPNIREYKTLCKLLFMGDFRYGREGVLDETHLRFFCRKNILDLFTSQGLGVEIIDTKLRRVRKLLNAMTLGIFEQFLVKQYLVVARK